MVPVAHTPHILLAEDDPIARTILQRFFDRANWRYELAADGQSGLNAARQKPFDIIITDYVMPGLNGLEFVRAVKKQRPNQAFILMSAVCSTEDALECLREGVEDYITKPVNFDRLSRSVQRIVAGIRSKVHEEKVTLFALSERAVCEYATKDLVTFSYSLPLVDRLWRVGRISLNQKLKVNLAIGEALTNAVDHGNLELNSRWREELDAEGVDRYSKIKMERVQDAYYADRKIVIETNYSHPNLTVTLTNQGPGFELSSNEQESSGLVAVHGRGLSIINGLMDKVEFADSGRKITMSINLEGR